MEPETLWGIIGCFRDCILLSWLLLWKMATAPQEIFENLPNFFEGCSDAVIQINAVRYIRYIAVFSWVIPGVMFVMFGITSVIVTFGCFLLVEVVLLAVGGMCMVACIVALMSVLSVLALILGVIYTVGLKVGYFIKNYETTSSILRVTAPSIDNINGVSHAHQS